MESHRCTKRFSLHCFSSPASARSGLCDLCALSFAICFCFRHPDYRLNKHLLYTLIGGQRGLRPALPTQVLSDQRHEGQYGAIALWLW